VSTFNQDETIRQAAFEHVRRLVNTNGFISSAELAAGFEFNGERIPLVNPQRGIFKPQRLSHLLSIRTVFPRPGRRIWYDDQREVHRQIFDEMEAVDYAFMGDKPEAPDNQHLRDAMTSHVPIIYFLGIAPSKYQAIVPTFVIGWDANSLKARIAFGLPDQPVHSFLEAATERRYALRIVKQRLHQASFREAVIDAYDGRCALSGLPEPRLLDAAHIIRDGDEALGHPIIANGIPLSKIHHVAFDSHLIGIDPDYRVHVSDRLRAKNDGPMLEVLKGLDGAGLRLPRRLVDQPDRNRLALRFEQFRRAN
jgi:putative restriction endonuclease